MTPSRKSNKKAGKKAAPKRAVAKKATARKGAKDRQKVNKDRLREDISYYEAQSPTLSVLPRTKPSKKNPRGVPLSSLKFNERGGFWYSETDRDIRVSAKEYERTPSTIKIANPHAVPLYTPLHKNRRIVAFRNTHNGDLVTPYYKYKIFNKYFNPKITPEEFSEGVRLSSEERERAAGYEGALRRQKFARQSRATDLVDSYQLLHPDMTRQQIIRDPTFQNLVGQLEVFHAGGYAITPENQAILEKVYGPNIGNVNEEGFAIVLVLLGRRLPSDTNPPGESDPNHIKNTVRPFYEAKNSSVPFEKEE